MKVYIDSRYIHERPSGIGEYVRALLNRLPALAPDDRFHLWVHPRATRPISDARNICEHVVRGDPNGLLSLLVPSRIGPTDGDVFHSPHNILGYGIRCATVVTLHDIMWLDEPHLVDGWALRRVFRVPFFRAGIMNALQTATRILTVSRASADAIIRAYPTARARLIVAHNAAAARFIRSADPDAARARAAKILGTPAPYFIVIGQNQPAKGHALALSAFSLLARTELQLLLIQRLRPGRGIDRLARDLGIHDRVTVLSGASPADIVTLLQSAVALLQPSLAEGFGMPALEAMACGCPVVASDIAPLVEVLGGAGLHVPRGQVEPLAEAMARIAEDVILQQELSERGLERARAFSWDDCAKITLEVYREAAAKGPQR